MFDTPKFKNFAKIQLKKRWTVPVLMCLVSAIVFSLLSVQDILNMRNSFIETISKNDFSIFYYAGADESLLAQIISVVASLCTFIFAVAQIHVYLKMSKSPEPVSFTNFFDGFNLWRKAILEGVWMTIWLTLWTMLFIIPGIVKSYAYSQAFYLIAEYPNISVRKALRISIAITRGYKADLFLQDLSFIGWGILCMLSCGVGFLWLLPYISMTRVNAYHFLVKKAIETNVITKDDLGLTNENATNGDGAENTEQK